jgi:hypothetical protein
VWTQMSLLKCAFDASEQGRLGGGTWPDRLLANSERRMSLEYW